MTVESWTYRDVNEFTHFINKRRPKWYGNRVSLYVSNVLHLYDKNEEPFLILNRGDFNRWLLKASMVGGGARILNQRDVNLSSFGVKWIGDYHGWYPEMIYIRSQYIHKVIKDLRKAVTTFIEGGPTREYHDELTKEFFPWRRIEPILLPSDIAWLIPIFSWQVFSKLTLNWDNMRLKIVRVFNASGLRDTAKEKMKAADSVVFIPTSQELIDWSMIRNGELIQISKLARSVYQQNMYKKACFSR